MAKTATRLYRVRGLQSVALVEATNPSQAIRHVAKGTFTVDVPTSIEVARIVASGVVPEKAGEQDDGDAA
jgi:hypothetical protein